MTAKAQFNPSTLRASFNLGTGKVQTVGVQCAGCPDFVPITITFADVLECAGIATPWPSDLNIEFNNFYCWQTGGGICWYQDRHTASPWIISIGFDTGDSNKVRITANYPDIFSNLAFTSSKVGAYSSDNPQNNALGIGDCNVGVSPWVGYDGNATWSASA